MMNELKTVLWVVQGLDGNSGRMGGCSRCFAVGDRKNLIADTKMYHEFQLCKHFENLFFSVSHRENAVSISMIFRLPK
jgi:hypothetical protein